MCVCVCAVLINQVTKSVFCNSKQLEDFLLYFSVYVDSILYTMSGLGHAHSEPMMEFMFTVKYCCKLYSNLLATCVSAKSSTSALSQKAQTTWSEPIIFSTGKWRQVFLSHFLGNKVTLMFTHFWCKDIYHSIMPLSHFQCDSCSNGTLLALVAVHMLTTWWRNNSMYLNGDLITLQLHHQINWTSAYICHIAT